MNRSAPRSSFAVVSVLILTVILLTGCNATHANERIAAFATATTQTTTNVSDGFRLVEEAYFETRSLEVVRKYAAGDVVDPAAVESFLPPEAIAARLDALKGLSKYAQGLSKLMGNESTEALGKEIDALAKAMTSLSENPAIADSLLKGRFTKDNVGLIAASVDAIGTALINYKRFAGAKALTEKMQIPVSKICKLLREDIGDPDNPDVAQRPGLRIQLRESYRKMMTDQALWLSQNTSTLNAVEQRAEVRRLLQMPKDQRAADAILASIYSSLAKLDQTHAQLVTAFDPRSYELDELIKQLAAEGRRIRDRYRELSNDGS